MIVIGILALLLIAFLIGAAFNNSASQSSVARKQLTVEERFPDIYEDLKEMYLTKLLEGRKEDSSVTDSELELAAEQLARAHLIKLDLESDRMMLQPSSDISVNDPGVW